jgi:hypothetical protein
LEVQKGNRIALPECVLKVRSQAQALSDCCWEREEMKLLDFRVAEDFQVKILVQAENLDDSILLMEAVRRTKCPVNAYGWMNGMDRETKAFNRPTAWFLLPAKCVTGNEFRFDNERAKP